MSHREHIWTHMDRIIDIAQHVHLNMHHLTPIRTSFEHHIWVQNAYAHQHVLIHIHTLHTCTLIHMLDGVPTHAR